MRKESTDLARVHADVEEEAVVGSRQVQAHGAGARREEEDGHVRVALKRLGGDGALCRGELAGGVGVADAGAVEIAPDVLQRFLHSNVCGYDQQTLQSTLLSPHPRHL